MLGNQAALECVVLLFPQLALQAATGRGCPLKRCLSFREFGVSTYSGETPPEWVCSSPVPWKTAESQEFSHLEKGQK